MAGSTEEVEEALSDLKMAGSSAEEVECPDELITNILSRVSTRDVVKMSTVRKRWHNLIFDPGFVYTHNKNCIKESIFCLIEIVAQPTPKRLKLRSRKSQTTPNQYKFRSHNSQTGNLSIVPFSLDGSDSSFQNDSFSILTASNGLMCFYPECLAKVPMLWVYNPVTKFVKKLPMPLNVDLGTVFFGEICYSQNTLKVVLAGMPERDEHPYTLVFDFHLNSWYRGQSLPLLRFINIYRHSYVGTQLFYNGVIYIVARVDPTDAQRFEGFKDLEGLYEDGGGDLHVVIGYDVNQDHWGFSLFVPASVGYIFRLTECEGNLLAISFRWQDGDGRFVFWILDTEHKLWVRERELDLSKELHTSWEVSASGGVVWFACGDRSQCGYDSLIVYHLKNRHWSSYRLDDALDVQTPSYLTFVTFEPTLLSF